MCVCVVLEGGGSNLLCKIAYLHTSNIKSALEYVFLRLLFHFDQKVPRSADAPVGRSLNSREKHKETEMFMWGKQRLRVFRLNNQIMTKVFFSSVKSWTFMVQIYYRKPKNF